MDHPDISCILYMWHARAENFSRNIGRNTTLWRIPANDNGYTTSYIYKSRFLSNRRKPHACLITLIHREFLSPCYKYFIFLHWQLKTSRMLASPFLIVKFVSRQVERLPSLKSKSYSFRGQTKSLFGSIYRTNSHLEASPQHIPATTHFVVSISVLASSRHAPPFIWKLLSFFLSTLVQSIYYYDLRFLDRLTREKRAPELYKNSYVRFFFFFFLRENLDPFHVSILDGRGGIDGGEFLVSLSVVFV